MSEKDNSYHVDILGIPAIVSLRLFVLIIPVSMIIGFASAFQQSGPH